MQDLERYLEEYVEPTIADFAGNPSSVRHAFIAAVVTFHCVDYLAHPRKSATLRDQWNKRSKAFAAVDDIAHAFKHVKTGNPANPDLRAREVVSMPGAFDAAAFDAGAFDVGSVTLENDTTVNVPTVLREALAFIREQIASPSGATPDDYPVTIRSPAGASPNELGEAKEREAKEHGQRHDGRRAIGAELRDPKASLRSA
jgi:hypothetical protein